MWWRQRRGEGDSSVRHTPCAQARVCGAAGAALTPTPGRLLKGAQSVEAAGLAVLGSVDYGGSRSSQRVDRQACGVCAARPIHCYGSPTVGGSRKSLVRAVVGGRGSE